MFIYMKYGPYICIGVVLAILFVLWAFWGGKNYEFVGLAPLSPETCGSYTGSLYNWGNITPATGYDPIEGHNCVPTDIACKQEEVIDVVNQSTQPLIIIDNTPALPIKFLDSMSLLSDDSPVQHTSVENIYPICPQEPVEVPQSVTQQNIPLILDYDPRQQNSYNIKSRPVQNLGSWTPPNNTALNLPQPRNPAVCNVPARGRFISRGERLCCQTLERIYGAPFASVWPDWLRNPETGETLELDCYNDDLKLAVEYNGEQHYKWPNFTNQSHQQFINQVRRDTFKVDTCDRNGVYLIVVPYNVPYDNIPTYIMSHLPETIQKRLQEENTLSTIRS